MKTLLIYLPTYNRLPQLKVCLGRLLEEVRGFENNVVIHVSDNCSTDGTAEYLQSLSHPVLQFSRNQTNIGLPRNILKSHDFASLAEYTWVIGDDDVVLSRAIARLLDAVKSNSDVDLIFLNTVGYDKRRQSELMAQIVANGYRVKPDWGSTKSKVKRDFKATIKEIFDPNIDEVFFGSLMCYAWRSGRVTNRLAADDVSQDFSKPKACYHIVLNYLYSLSPETPALHLHDPFTVGFWHEGVDWGTEGLDLAVTQGLGIVLYEAIRLGYVNREDRTAYFAHYMAIASGAYKRFLESGKFRDRLSNFHCELAEMTLRYGVAPFYPTARPLRSKLADASPRKVYQIVRILFTRMGLARLFVRSAA